MFTLHFAAHGRGKDSNAAHSRLRGLLVAFSLFVMEGILLSQATNPAAKAPVDRKELADRLILPHVQFQDASLEECVEFFRIRDSDPPININIVLKVPPATRSRPVINLDLRNVSLAQALRQVAANADMKVLYAPGAILIREKNAPLAARPEQAQSSAAQKAAGIIFPAVLFNGASVEEALEFFRKKSRDLDPRKEGVEVLLKPGTNVENVKVSLELHNISGLDALHYFADQADLKLTADNQSLVLVRPEK